MDKKHRRFVGEVATWSLGNPEKPRLSTCLKITYKDYREFFQVAAYNDTTGKGWQRKQSREHVRKLGAAMEADKYTEAGFSGGLLPSHERNLRTFEEGGKSFVEFTATANAKVPCIDGHHRGGALDEMWQKAKDAKDHGRMGFIDGQEIWVQVYLDSTHLQSNFMNLQKGRPVDRNTARSMEFQTGEIDEERRSFFDVADRVAHALSQNPDIFLCGNIQFDSISKRPVQYNSITTFQGSDLACSLYGGARIALAHGKNAEWLEKTYVEAWDALLHRGAAEKGRLPKYLQPTAMLHVCSLGGKRGPSLFVLAIGNLLAWRKCHQGHEEASERDLDLIAEVANDLMTGPPIGWSGDDKRVWARRFAEAYLADLVDDGEPPTDGKVPSYQGVPVPLVACLTPGAFKIDKSFLPKPEGRKGRKADEPLALEDSLESEVAADALPEPVVVKGKRRRLVAANQA